MAQLFEKALIILLATIAVSIALGGMEGFVKNIQVQLTAGACEVVASKIIDASYLSIFLGKEVETVLYSSVPMKIGISGDRLTVSSESYNVTRKLPRRANEFSKMFTGKYKIVIRYHDDILEVDGFQW